MNASASEKRSGIQCAILFVALFAAPSANNLTGKWTGSLVFNDGGVSTAYLDLHQNGTVLTGIVGLSEGHEFKISRGSIHGTEVTVEAKTGNSVLLITAKLRSGVLAGDLYEEENKVGTLSLKKKSK